MCKYYFNFFSKYLSCTISTLKFKKKNVSLQFTECPRSLFHYYEVSKVCTLDKTFGTYCSTTYETM